MEALDKKYTDQLDAIAEELLNSERLQKYLEDEEEEDFQALRDTYEPQINKIYKEVADTQPLQLIAFEQYLLDPKFEGVFLPKLLGYSVLRGEVGRNFKYTFPQDHFKDILLAICNSSNFDYLKKRIGQSIQTAFALSSDIWITNLINVFDNKRIRYFLQGQKLDKYRDERERTIGYKRFANQFRNENFYTADFPSNRSGLKTLFSALKKFLIYRIESNLDNSSLIPKIKEFLDNEAFQGTQEHVDMMGLYAGFFERNETDESHLKSHFAKAQTNNSNFTEQFFDYQITTLKSDLDLDGKADQKVSNLLDRSQPNSLTRYFDLMDIVHGKGYVHEEAVEAVKNFYNSHSGLSIENECVRYTILSYLKRLITNLDESEYTEYFKIAQIFPVYMNIFGNQKFNQHIKDLSMTYVKKLLKKYTDKRGKDYQDIKKFVSTTFIDLAFLKEKEVVELFKTRRKKKKPVS